jgi:hypothetical protein
LRVNVQQRAGDACTGEFGLDKAEESRGLPPSAGDDSALLASAVMLVLRRGVERHCAPKLVIAFSVLDRCQSARKSQSKFGEGNAT